MCQQLGEVIKGHGAQINAFTRTHSNGSCLDFPISDNQKIRNLEQGMLPDFKADLFVSQVGLGTEAALVENFLNLASEIGLLVGDIHHHRLRRSKPGRERALIVLD